jgi:7-cyano-7-deazaguanine tRNA-ribosyltransferase
MEFFVSWYCGDACYPLYDDDCSLLISVTSVPQGWTIRSLPKLPKRLLIDSGGFHLISTTHIPRQLLEKNASHTPKKKGGDSDTREDELLHISPKKILERQLAILDGENIPAIVCALDYPILNTDLCWQEKEKRITQTIAFACELKSLIAQYGLERRVTPMAIVQGYDVDSLKCCAYELSSIGFPLYGLGSLAPLKRHTLIMERVQAVASIVGAEKLHIFGVSVVETVQAFREMGIHSIDSARPAKSAAYNEILYSTPFRRFGILEPTTSSEVLLQGRIPRARRLQSPLKCNCPICLENPSSIMGVGKRANIRDRGAHNYYHLKRIFCGLERD